MAKIYSLETRGKARDLRSKGCSIGEISLKIGIPKSTILGWVRDICLSEKQRRRIKQKIIASGAIGRPLAVKANRKKMEKWKEEIRGKVKHFEKLSLLNPDTGKLICGLLYLCEGAKYPSTRCLIFGNSDPTMIRCFLNLLKTSFNIKEDKLRCRIMYRWDQNIEELKRYWSNITGIPLSHFFRTKPDKRTKGKPTLRTDYKGVCSILYPDTSLQFQLQAIGEAIIKNGAEGS